MVKRIFGLCVAGKVPSRIAKILKADNVLIAKAYYAKRKGKALHDNPYNWKDSTIVGILERTNYCGHTEEENDSDYCIKQEYRNYVNFNSGALIIGMIYLSSVFTCIAWAILSMKTLSSLSEGAGDLRFYYASHWAWPAERYMSFGDFRICCGLYSTEGNHEAGGSYG